MLNRLEVSLIPPELGIKRCCPDVPARNFGRLKNDLPNGHVVSIDICPQARARTVAGAHLLWIVCVIRGKRKALK